LAAGSPLCSIIQAIVFNIIINGTDYNMKVGETVDTVRFHYLNMLLGDLKAGGKEKRRIYLILRLLTFLMLNNFY